MRDYNKVKLGLIDRYLVWKIRRDALREKKLFNTIDGNFSEVDFSYADRLQTELLTRKKIKMATRDAKRLFRKENRVFSMSDKDKFIEQYLVENGLMQKALPEAKPNNHDFIEKYPTQEPSKEIPHEQTTQIPEIYYKIGNDFYKTSFAFSFWYFDSINNGLDPHINLRTNDGKSYFIEYDKMQSEDKYNMLNRLINTSLNDIGQYLAQSDVESGFNAHFSNICNQASYMDYIAKNLYAKGNIDEAVTKLETMTERIFKYKRDEIEQEPEQDDERDER